MIFSKQKLDKAFTYMSKYYNKILFIDLETDQFSPIKVNDREWQTFTYTEVKSFSDWAAGFFESPFYSSNGDNTQLVKSIMTLRNLEKLKQVTTPITMEYKKIIDGVFHDVMLEFIPIENNQAYLFVKDLYLMQKGIYEYED